MTKIEAVVREELYEDIKDALSKVGVHGVTVTQVMGCGEQKGYSSIVRGSKIEVNMLPKIKFEIIVSSDEWAEKVIDVVRATAFTGNPGDGKIFIYDLKDAVRIRTGERGKDAII
jgi:nitrogen regulatory protein P-II 1